MKTLLLKQLFLLCIFGARLHSAETTPYQHEIHDELVNSQLKLNTESMGAFSDAMKSYIMYTLAQNIPGTKESGVGYYYDHKSKSMERVLFYRFGSGYSRQTNRRLDCRIQGKGLFVIELPGGWPAYTHDGRFELDPNGRLVMLGYPTFPVLGENGPIYLPDDNVDIDESGAIYRFGELVDVLRIEWVQDTHDLQSFNQQIYYLELENQHRKKEPKYTIMQGYVEDSTVTKAYIGLVPEWKNGHESNVKVVKSYIQNMKAAVQQANP